MRHITEINWEGTARRAPGGEEKKKKNCSVLYCAGHTVLCFSFKGAEEALSQRLNCLKVGRKDWGKQVAVVEGEARKKGWKGG